MGVSSSFVNESIMVIFIRTTIEHLTDTSDRHVQNSISTLIPQGPPIEVLGFGQRLLVAIPPLISLLLGLLEAGCTLVSLCLLFPVIVPGPFSPDDGSMFIDNSNASGIVNHTSDISHLQGQSARVEARQGDKDVDDQHNQPSGNGQTPPPVWVVVDTQLMKKRRGEEGPEQVDEEGERGGQIEGEAIVLIGRDFWTSSGDGFRCAE